MNDSYNKQRGLFDSAFEDSGIDTPTVPASESKVLEQNYKEIGKSVCACGNDAFSIFFKDYKVVAKCTACENEATVYQG